jgi:dTDP-4-dehydrorhamnose reductase/UDP-glucose 4-epimerase
MFSSRKVYGSNNDLLFYTEDSPINPNDHYGLNKAYTENTIKSERDKNIILRASNVFGLEYQRKSYMGFLMNQLKDSSNIEIDVSPYTTRDFISVQDVSKLVNLIVEKEIKGTYNLSSGYGEMVGSTADYLIKGYGSGSLISKSKERKDQFILDNTKLLNALNIDMEFDIENQMIKLGEQLCKI